MPSPHTTSYTLLQRAVDNGDEAAWSTLVEHYKRFIYYVLHGMRVAQDDIDDITQQVLISLYKDLANYDASKARFRTWLSAMIRNIAINHFRHSQSQARRIEGAKNAAIFEHMGRENEIDDHIEKEWANYIVTQAMERVRPSFRGHAMEVFELGLEGVPAAEIAERTKLSIASVYTLRKRVKKALFLEIQELTADLER